MNNENLVPFDRRTESEQRELAKKGGEASGKARRRAKTLRELAKEIGGASVTITDTTSGSEIECTRDEAILIQQYAKAMNGDTRAADFILKVKGESQLKVELEQRDNTDDRRKFEEVFGIIIPDNENGGC